MMKGALLSNLNQIKYFYIAAKRRSYTKAASELFVTEPAVHMQVRSLECSLGFKLLDKTGKELKLTESGEVLYNYTEKIFCLVEEAVSALTQLHNLKKGSLRLGTVKALAQHFMPIIISSFHKCYPGIRILLNEDASCDIVDGILHHRYDLAIVGRVPYPPLINAIPLARLDVFVVVSSLSKFSQKEIVSIYEIVDEPLICRTPRAASRVKIEEEFGKRGLKPWVIVEVENVDLIKKLVKRGEGYSFLSEWSIGEEIKRGELIPLCLKEGRVQLDIDVIYMKNETLQISASAFLRFLEESKERLWSKAIDDSTQCISSL
jgi:DNA-binding transcriptional LysR family regulator